MNVSELYSARSVAAHWTEAASNRIPYLGANWFPSRKKQGIDIKDIRAHKGLAVSLAPSNFDATSTLRAREGFRVEEKEMAFFRESMLLKERDEQDIARIVDADDPYAADVMSRIYDDADTLLAGAEVVAERMRMQLLCPDVDGSPRILIASDNKQYSYNYDIDGSYATNNYKAMSGTSMWTDATNADPLADLETAINAAVENTGTRPVIALMNTATFNAMKKSEKVKSAVLAQNITANVYMNSTRVKELVKNELGLTIIIYDKQFKDEAGVVTKFYKDGFVALLPEGELGTTWYGVTPEERTLNGKTDANVSIIGEGVAVVVKITEDPVNTKTTVSEIVLPSFERMEETYVLKVF